MKLALTLLVLSLITASFARAASTIVFVEQKTLRGIEQLQLEYGESNVTLKMNSNFLFPARSGVVELGQFAIPKNPALSADEKMLRTIARRAERQNRQTALLQKQLGARAPASSEHALKLWVNGQRIAPSSPLWMSVRTRVESAWVAPGRTQSSGITATKGKHGGILVSSGAKSRCVGGGNPKTDLICEIAGVGVAYFP